MSEVHYLKFYRIGQEITAVFKISKYKAQNLKLDFISTKIDVKVYFSLL